VRVAAGNSTPVSASPRPVRLLSLGRRKLDTMDTTNGREVSPAMMGLIAEDLRALTAHLAQTGLVDETRTGLGGQYGYGADFTNDTFEMRPYYWGDCECGHEDAETAWLDTHHHAPTCYQGVIRARGFIDASENSAQRMSWADRTQHNDALVRAACAEMGLDPDVGSYTHCTCTYTQDWEKWVDAHPHAPTCGIVAPNFLHKPTTSTVSFYKYLGRSMNADLNGQWADIINDCKASVTRP
jgi:hypothetical protein